MAQSHYGFLPAEELVVRIDVVSDVACPWCAIGVSALERALTRVGTDVGEVEVHVQPFELNPTMGPEGADAAQYLSDKYGLSPEQLAENRARITERGAAEGFTFGTRSHVWNTFDAHRLLFFAGVEGPPGAQRALKRALLKAYHGDGRNIAAADVLVELAAEAGLPASRAREVLERGEYANEVRQAERHRRPQALDLGWAA
jgi:predicted DsbA family dithiol-disulfide isomerase